MGVFTPTLKVNCDFTLTFCNFVILSLFYKNKSIRLPLRLTLLEGCEINILKEKGKPFIIGWKNKHYHLSIESHPLILPLVTLLSLSFFLIKMYLYYTRNTYMTPYTYRNDLEQYRRHSCPPIFAQKTLKKRKITQRSKRSSASRPSTVRRRPSPSSAREPTREESSVDTKVKRNTIAQRLWKEPP